MNTQTDRKDALKEEIDFWHRSFSKTFKDKDCSKILNDPEHIKGRFPKHFLKCIESYKRAKNISKLRCLEIGGGPFSNIIYGATSNLFELTSIDPLAKEYEILLRENHCSSPIRMIAGTGERIFNVVEEKSFDFAYSRNALDHTEDPEKCISNMTKALKPNGILFLMGFLREGSHERWKQLHQYDFWPENGNLHYAKCNGNTGMLTSGLDLTCILQESTSDLPGDRGYTIAFQKHPRNIF